MCIHILYELKDLIQQELMCLLLSEIFHIKYLYFTKVIEEKYICNRTGT